MKKILTTFLSVAAVAAMTASATAAVTYTAAAQNSNQATGKTEQVAAGSSFENATYFPNINITIPQDGATFAGNTLQFTSDKGYNKAVAVNTMFYDMGMGQIIVQVGNEEIKESGVYTLHMPANFITIGGEGNAAADLTWTYTNTASQGGEDEKDLTLTSFTVNGVNMLAANPKLDLLQNKTPISINIDPIPEAVMLTVKFKEKATGANIRSMEVYNIPTNPDVVVDPAKGQYKSVVSGRAVNKFYEGTEYFVEITGYSSTNAANPTNKVWGPVNVDFEGASEAYKFSTAKYVSITPADNSEVTDPSTPVVITFSEPVESVTCVASEGGQGGAESTMTNIKANADKTVWTITPGASFWNSSDSEWTFRIAAKDAEGRVVEGNHGVEAGSEYYLTLGCFLAWPDVYFTPAAGMVEELYSFDVTDVTGSGKSRGIGFSWTGTPYVVNEAGETVAKADLNSQIQYDAQGRDIATLPLGDFTAVKMSFHLNQAITEPGKYKLIVPRASFNIGQEQNADANRYMELEYTVVPMVAVNVELADFAKASFKVGKGNNVNVALAPAADWKLATLTLNDEDVTAQVKNDVYALTANEDSNLVASYEYAKEVKIVATGESTGITSVEGKEYKVSNLAEYIKIENLQGGEIVNVFTANGMKVATQTATTDTMEITVPNGQVYIVTINNAAVKVAR